MAHLPVSPLRIPGEEANVCLFMQVCFLLNESLCSVFYSGFWYIIELRAKDKVSFVKG